MAQPTQEEIWLADTCTEIRKSPALQYFFQTFFENTGLYSPVPLDRDLTDRANGQRDVALDVKLILDEVDPLLFPELLLARTTYLMQQNEDDDNGS